MTKNPDADELEGHEVEQEIGQLTEDLAASKNGEHPPQQPPQAAPSIWRSWPVAVFLMTISVAVTIANFAGWGPFQRDPTPLTQQQEQRVSELELLALVGYIEDYQEDKGRLPQNLESLEIDLGESVVVYELINNEDYMVTVSRGEVQQTFDSRRGATEPPPPSG